MSKSDLLTVDSLNIRPKKKIIILFPASKAKKLG
jgi:hypothetical protein